jgi:hypothetical protein
MCGATDFREAEAPRLGASVRRPGGRPLRRRGLRLMLWLGVLLWILAAAVAILASSPALNVP